MELIDVITSKENLNRAYKKVAANKGAGGVDGMKVEELGIAHSVRFLGVRNDVSKILSAIDVFIFPSISEGLPLAVVEAQCSGLPCIVSTGVSEMESS